MENRQRVLPELYPYIDMRAEQSRLSHVMADPVDPEVARLLPELVARRYSMIPFARTDAGLCVALSLPLSDEAEDYLYQLGEPLLFFRASPAQLRAALRRVWDPHSREMSWSDFVRVNRSAPGELSDILLDDEMVDVDALNRALQEQAQTQTWLGSILISTNSVTPFNVAKAVAMQHRRPMVDLLAIEDGRQGLQMLDPGLFASMPAAFWRDARMIPISRRDKWLVVAVTNLADESNIWLGRLQETTGLVPRPIITGYRDIIAALQTVYGIQFVVDSREGLRERRPEDSASYLLSRRQIVVGVGGTACIVAGGILQPLAVIVALNAIAQFFYLGLTLGKLGLLTRLRNINTGIDISPEQLAQVDRRTLPIYTVLVPAYKETSVLHILAKALSELDYPHDRLDIKLLLEADDTQMILAAQRLRLPNFIEIVTVPVSQPRTKPKACNYGLHLARGEYTVIFDAEDIPDPDQLLKAVVAFRMQGPEVACIQAKLAYYNRHENLLTRWFTAEYLMWFDLMLPALHAFRVPIPLGGTSNHFRTSVLRDIGAWDPYNVAEDADLGIRLHKVGYKTVILDSTTYEEANSRLGNWIRQRSRWVKGYMVTWIVHMRHPIALWQSMGLRGFLWFHAVIGGTAATLVLNPLYMALTMLWYVTYEGALRSPFPTWVYWVAAINLFLGNFAFTYANMVAVVRRNVWDLVGCALLSPFYWMLMSIASWKALIQLITRPSYWEKTDHGLTSVGQDEHPAVL